MDAARRLPLGLQPIAAALVVLGLVLPARAASPGQVLGGQPCRPIEVPAGPATPVGVGACPGVRPGATLLIPGRGLCSMNFLFAGSDGRRYVGTAGHCIVDRGQERTWAPGAGPLAQDGTGARIGEFAYGIQADPKDFALVRLDPGVPASAQMCHFGGPTGLNVETRSGPVVLHHFGQGVVVGWALPARTAVAATMPDPDVVWALGAVAPGDSGSGAISADGKAVGVVVAVGVAAGFSGGVPMAGTVGITRLGPQVARASAALGVGLTLLTAPLS